jgi:hypothetical protein
MYSVPACIFLIEFLSFAACRQCKGQIQRGWPDSITTLFNFEILLLVLKLPNRSVPKSRSSYELQSHMCPCSHLGENHAASFQLFMSLSYSYIDRAYTCLQQVSWVHTTCYSFSICPTVVLEFRIDYDVKFAFCRKTIRLAFFDRDLTLSSLEASLFKDQMKKYSRRL